MGPIMKLRNTLPIIGERLVHLAGLALATGLMLALAKPAAAVEVRVQQDRATLVKVAGQAATVIVGNPLYANVHVLDKRLVIQGRHKGKTNVIVLDVDGNELARFDVVVAGEPNDQLAMYNGNKRVTYLCKPECAQVLNSGDDTTALTEQAKRMQIKDQVIQQTVKSSEMQ